jgi:hypothetical protein
MFAGNKAVTGAGLKGWDVSSVTDFVSDDKKHVS